MTSRRRTKGSAIAVRQPADGGHYQQFVTRWRVRAEEFKRVEAHVDAAALIDQLLSDIATLRRIETGHTMTLGEAAAESGYSAEHLGRLVREGKIANAGRPNSPRVRRGDLPRKPPGAHVPLAENASAAYDVATDVRSLRVRRGESQ